LHELISSETPLIGLEPSAILGFRDEYLALMPDDLQEKAESLAKNCLLFEEWFCREIDAKNIKKEAFVSTKKMIKLHGHCHQKALAGQVSSKKMLAFPAGHEVHLIPSGCCGMAGSFGYEKEHYETSQKIGELVLFPAIRKFDEAVIVAAAGTSCRHQIKDGTAKIALHPAEIMYDSLA
jgi:Fe-S oxidoreductase